MGGVNVEMMAKVEINEKSNHLILLNATVLNSTSS
jgi:hypothetical protein